HTAILSPKGDLLRKLAVFVPLSHVEPVRTALFAAGAGQVGKYDQCSFNVAGYGTFRGGEGTDPFVGNPGEMHREEELRMEVIFPANRERAILLALFEAHPYEEVAYDLYRLQNSYQEVGSGLIGYLEHPLSEHEILGLLQQQVNAPVVRHTALRRKPIVRVAVCEGPGRVL